MSVSNQKEDFVIYDIHNRRNELDPSTGGSLPFSVTLLGPRNLKSRYVSGATDTKTVYHSSTSEID